MLIRLLILFLVLSNSSIAFAQSTTDLRGDTIDLRKTVLNLDFSNFGSQIMQGEAVITIRSKQTGVNQIRLDLLHLTVDSVQANGTAIPYTYNDTTIHCVIPVLNAGDSALLTVFYHGHPYQQTGDFGGFYWDTHYAFNIGVSFLSDPHNYGRVWFPCFDNFTERELFEYYIKTDSIRRAFCNGTLQNVTTNADSTKTWHWALAEQIPSYLASVAVADYVALTDTFQGINGTTPIKLAVRIPDSINLKASFMHLKNAARIFEGHFGAYPFERIGYCIVPFTAGAMEHATNISYMELLVDGTTNYENIMAHELSHHWFGDLATTDRASEMWMNEGWAVYNEKLFYEGLYGRARYQSEVRKNHENVLHFAHVRDSAYLAVSGVPSQYTYGATVYDKGCDMVHTLRSYLADSTFFSCIKSYLAAHRYTDVNSWKLRDYLSTCSGISLTNFFNDWIFQPGFPHFAIDRITSTNTGAGTYNVQVCIHQTLDHALHLAQGVPMELAFFDSAFNKTVKTMVVNGANTTFTTTLNFNPVYTALDFDEKISDAITDEWKVLKTNGNYDFGTAKWNLTINRITDSALVRIEHHWAAPDRMRNVLPGLHLHDYRYWTVNGIFPANFAANARIVYDGSTNMTTGYLDNTFITNSEDSLTLMYRPNADSDWQFADSFKVNTQGNVNNKLGYITIFNVQKGDYAMAIWNSNLPDDTANTRALCPTNSIQNQTALAIDNIIVYPNPTNSLVTIQFPNNHLFSQLELTDLSGRRIISYNSIANVSALDLSLNGYSAGVYLLICTAANGERVTKRVLLN